MKTIIKLLIGIPILLISCAEHPDSVEKEDVIVQNLSEDQDLIVVDLYQDLTIESDLTLSNIASEITYTKLESNVDCFVKMVDKYSITDEYLLIYDRMQDLIFLFDRSGKYLRKISRKGNGPGEYNRPNDVRISQDESCILIHSNKQVLKYSFEGEFIGVTPLLSWAIAIDTYSDGLVGFFPSGYSILMDNFSIVTFDWDGRITGQYGQRNWDWLKPGDPIKRSKYYSFNGIINIHEAYYDTIYCLTPDKEFKPRLYFKLENTNEELRTITDDQKKLNIGGFQMGGWLETDDYFFINGPYNRIMHPMIYVRETEKVIYLPYDLDLGSFGLPNDIDGGAPFWPGRYYKGKLYTLQYPNKLKHVLDNALIDVAKFNNQYLRKKLLSFRDELSEEDGQILIEVKLK